MKGAYLKSTFRDIFKAPGRMLSIILIIMMGVLLFVGIKAVGPNLENTMDSYYRKYNLSDVQVTALNGFSEEDKNIYKDRLIEELTIYDKMDFSSYPLVLEEIINHANSKGILTGPGRGSAAGSLISYALGLTKIDPIPYGLMFSRYLSAGRAKYPLIEFEGYPLSEWNKKNE